MSFAPNYPGPPFTINPNMTTNLNAVAGPSTLSPSPKSEPRSPQMTSIGLGEGSGPGVSKPGLSVDENGEVVKVPAFLNKLFR
jgi:heat shock transcription factor